MFTGKYRRGSLKRHMRHKHKAVQGAEVVEKTLVCEAFGCSRVFKRQDSRLKHHRKIHPELDIAGAVPRKQQFECILE
jgi:hypothetical protein